MLWEETEPNNNKTWMWVNGIKNAMNGNIQMSLPGFTLMSNMKTGSHQGQNCAVKINYVKMQ